nr:hypothetical protein Iba_chr03aCG9780 [Ipomoea batatas]
MKREVALVLATDSLLVWSLFDSPLMKPQLRLPCPLDGSFGFSIKRRFTDGESGIVDFSSWNRLAEPETFRRSEATHKEQTGGVGLGSSAATALSGQLAVPGGSGRDGGDTVCECFRRCSGPAKHGNNVAVQRLEPGG